MLRLFTPIALLSSLLTGPVPSAYAETLDIATLKCADIVDSKPEEIGLILSWIDGYLGGRADDTRFDIERFEDNMDVAAKACEDDPNAGLLTVIKAADKD